MGLCEQMQRISPEGFGAAAIASNMRRRKKYSRRNKPYRGGRINLKKIYGKKWQRYRSR